MKKLELAKTQKYTVRVQAALEEASGLYVKEVFNRKTKKANFYIVGDATEYTNRQQLIKALMTRATDLESMGLIKIDYDLLENAQCSSGFPMFIVN